MVESSSASGTERPGLSQIADVFARYGNFTLGGGSATSAVIHGQIVTRRHWVTDQQFALCYALGRLTPGTNVLAFCTGIHDTLVTQHGVLTEQQLNEAVVITRSTPGPVGLSL